MQLGFGMSALQSGLITFSSAAGAMLMKAAGVRVLRKWGFRTTKRAFCTTKRTEVPGDTAGRRAGYCRCTRRIA